MKEAKIEFDCGLTELLQSLTSEFKPGDRFTTAMKGRLATVTLPNGKKGQVQVYVTTEREEFLMPVKLNGKT